MEFDFSQSETLDNLDGVPEPFRPAYLAGEDGKFVIAPTFKPLAEAITGLNRALKSERTEHGKVKGQKDVQTAVKEALGNFGIEDLATARSKIEELTTTVANRASVDPAKIRAEIEATFAGERTASTARTEKMQRRLESHLIGRTAATEIAGAKGNAILLMPHVEKQCRVVEDGDEYVVRVVDADGQWRGDGKGGYMGVGDLVNEMKVNRSFASAFESDVTNPQRQQQQQQQPTRPGPKTVVTAANPQGEKNAVDKVAAGLAALRNRR